LKRQPGYRTSRGFANMTDASVENLLRTLNELQRSLQAMQTALVEFDADLLRQSSSGLEEKQRPAEESGSGLLSISEVCQELGMGKSWVYHRLKSGEIPSIKLGNNIKVKRSDLEQYLESQRYQPPVGEAE
jgi:excisionase family DNA binding protein